MTSQVTSWRECSFLSSLCDEIGTVGDLQSVAASLGLKYSQVEQILTSFPHDFPAAVFATLAGWYTSSRSMFWKKLDDLEDAFKEMHKGALFNRIVNAHSVTLQRVSSLPQIRRPTSEALDESLGEAVMNAIEIIPSCHLRLLRTLLWEILSDRDLLYYGRGNLGLKQRFLAWKVIFPFLTIVLQKGLYLMVLKSEYCLTLELLEASCPRIST